MSCLGLRNTYQSFDLLLFAQIQIKTYIFHFGSNEIPNQREINWKNRRNILLTLFFEDLRRFGRLVEVGKLRGRR